MRESIGKYKGRRIDNGEFITGHYFTSWYDGKRHEIACKNGSESEYVDPETVQQFIIQHTRGAKFPNPALDFPIYEGDLLYVAGLGELRAVWDEFACGFEFVINKNGHHLHYDYQQIIEDIERVIEVTK